MKKLSQFACASEENNEVVEISKSVDEKIQSNDIVNARATSGGSGSPLIRVLCLFTPAAEATGLNMTDLANTAKSQWLTAQLNSSVHSNLQIVGVEELNFVENGVPESQTGNGFVDSDFDVDRLRDDINAQQLRDQFEADIVMLFTNGNYPGIGGIVAEIGLDEDDHMGA